MTYPKALTKIGHPMAFEVYNEEQEKALQESDTVLKGVRVILPEMNFKTTVTNLGQEND